MRTLWRKDTDYLLTDEGISPPAGYLPADELPPVADALQYTYHWLRGDGSHLTGRYGLLRAMHPHYLLRPERPRKPRDKARRALQARLYRLQNKEYWYKQRQGLFPREQLAKKLRVIRRKIEEIRLTLRRE